MARRETQGYQIAVVILLIVWVLTTVTMFIFANKYKTTVVERDAAKADSSKNGQALRDALAEGSKLKEWIGFEGGDSFHDMEKMANRQEDPNKPLGTDWARYAPNVPETQRTFRGALEAMLATLADARNNLRIAQTEVQTLKDRNEAREAAKDKQIAEYRQELEKTRTDLTTMTANYLQDKNRLETTNADMARQADDARTSKASIEQKYTQDADKWTRNDVRRTEEIKMHQTTISELRGEVAAVPDGAVSQVDQRQGLVWINLGELDGLKRQVTFSVYGRDNNGVAKGARKAAVEVTQILGPHSAQARILEDNIKNPIIRGDQIYTPLWHPGRPERFALAGFMDIDGDDTSDRDIIHQLITMNGGIIDAEVDDAGKSTGELTHDTRYLVLGERKGAGEEVASTMNRQAQDLGLQVLSVDKFLDHVGYKNVNKLLQYGSDRYRDFKGALPDGGRRPSTGYTSERFRERHPREKKPTSSAFDRPAATTPSSR